MISRSYLPKSPLLHGLAIAGSAVPASLLLGYLGSAYVNGFDGLIIGLALLGGLVLSAILITPAVQSAGAESLPGYVSQRFGPAAGTISLIVTAIASLFLITAELRLASMIIATLTHVAEGAILMALAVSAAGLSLLAKTRAGPIILASLAVLLVFAVWASVWIVSGGDLVPHLGYGSAVRDISNYETTMMESGLADFRSLKAHARAFLELDALNTIALAVTVAAGALILIPASKQPHLTARASRLASVVSALAAMAVLISIPALASYTKREVYATITRGTPLMALPSWLEAPSRADLVRIHGLSAKTLEDVTRIIAGDPALDAAKVQAALASEPAWAASHQAFSDAKPAVKTALLDAAKAMAAASGVSSWETLTAAVLPQAAAAQNNKTGLLTHGALTISPWAVPMLVAGIAPGGGLTSVCLVLACFVAAVVTARRLADGISHALPHTPPVTRRSSAQGVLAAGTGLALMASSASALWLAFTGLSIAAASLFPALLAGAWSRRVSKAAVIAAMCAGAAVSVTYSVATHVFAAEAYQMMPSLSNASDGTKKKFESLTSAWQKAPEGEAKTAAWNALESYAAGNATRPNMAEWWGISSSSSAILALPIAFLVLLVVDAPRRLSHRVHGRA